MTVTVKTCERKKNLRTSEIRKVASPGFVARRGKDENYVMGTHGGLHGRVQQLTDD